MVTDDSVETVVNKFAFLGSISEKQIVVIWALLTLVAFGAYIIMPGYETQVLGWPVIFLWTVFIVPLLVVLLWILAYFQRVTEEIERYNEEIE